MASPDDTMDRAPKSTGRSRAPLRAFAVAIQFFTRLSTPKLDAYRDDDLARSAPWLPAVGLLVGAVVATAVVLGSLAGGVVAAALALLAWVFVTGGLHLDGLADSVDGLAAAHGRRTGFLEAARDPHIGAFGVIAIVLVVIFKFAALSQSQFHAGPDVFGLVLIPAWARWTACVAAARLPALGEGLGATFKRGLGWRVLALSGGGLALMSAVAAPILVPAAALATVGAIWFWRSRVGGVNGDTLGATIEVVESGLLLVWLAVPLAPALVVLTSVDAA